ncbi:MAG: carboxypeptidase regulatory-like domain-containing protein [Planctomycetes bacterium]|nr:carboxypeptidase regulatory-like domain-containing protein [Planctomycetota bacterium]
MSHDHSFRLLSIPCGLLLNLLSGETILVRGKITAADWKTPIADATVTAVRSFHRNDDANEPFEIQTRSDEEGNFQFELELSNAYSYQISATAPGWSTGYCHVTGRYPPEKPLTLCLLRSKLRGQAVGPDGQPIPKTALGVFVCVRDPPYALDHYVTSGTTHQVETDDRAAFVLFVPPGKVTLQVVARGIGCGSSEMKVVGEDDEIDIGPLPLTPFGTLTGRVLEEGPEAPMVDVIVRVSSPLFAFDESVKTDDRGCFRVQIPPGEVHFSAHKEGFYWSPAQQLQKMKQDIVERQTHDRGLDAKAIIESGKTVQGDDLKLVRLVELAGQVIDADGKPVQDATALYSPEDLTIELGGGHWSHGLPGAEGKTDADGQFSLKVVPTTGTLMVSTENHVPDNRVLELKPGNPRTRLPVQLLMRAAKVSGRVIDKDTGKPVEDSRVYAKRLAPATQEVTPETSRPRERQDSGPHQKFHSGPGGMMANTDRDGQYFLAGLSAGDYQLSAEWNTHQTWSHKSATATIHLNPGQHLERVNLELTLPEKGMIGKLRTSDGKSLARTPYFWVMKLEADPTCIFGDHSTTDTDGRFCIQSRPTHGEKIWLITLCVKGYRPSTTRIVLPEEGRPENLNIELEPVPIGILSGRVFLPDGRTLAAGVRVFAYSDAPFASCRGIDSIGLTSPPLSFDIEFAHTDPEGAFRLELDEGTYGVIATPVEDSSDRGMGRSKVPISPNLAGLAPVWSELLAIKGGQETQADVTLVKEGAVIGRVTDMAGRPLPGAKAWLQRTKARLPEQLIPESVSTDQDGRFRIVGVPPGFWGLMACADAFPWQYAEIEVESGQEVRKDFQLERN